MPHTNRHKRRPEWNRTTTVTSPDGWSTVISTRPKPLDQILQDHKPNGEFHDSEVTEEIIANEYHNVMKTWQKTDAAAQLQRILGSKKDLQINKAICFGLGSLSLVKNLRLQSMMQLAALVDVTCSLQSTDQPIRICLQDPAFTQTDIRFLQSLNMHVIEGNEGFAQITENTLVYLPFTPWKIVLKHAEQINVSPLIITPDMSKIDTQLYAMKKTVDLGIEQVQQLTSNREIISFPTHEKLHRVFEDFKIYGAESEVNDETKAAF